MIFFVKLRGASLVHLVRFYNMRKRRINAFQIVLSFTNISLFETTKDDKQGTNRLPDQSFNIKTENESFRRPT